jgi:hypothetical protein
MWRRKAEDCNLLVYKVSRRQFEAVSHNVYIHMDVSKALNKCYKARLIPFSVADICHFFFLFFSILLFLCLIRLI